jgi:hypothetical protein
MVQALNALPNDPRGATMTRELIRDACPDHRVRAEAVRIPTATTTKLDAFVYRAGGAGPHPAVAMVDELGAAAVPGLELAAERFSAEGFTSIALTREQAGSDDYRSVFEWARTQRDVDATRVFAWCRCLDDPHALKLATADSRLRGAIVHTPSSHDVVAVRAPGGSWCRRRAMRALLRGTASGRGGSTSTTSYPVLFVVGGKTSDLGLLRRMAKHEPRIEVFVAKPRTGESERGKLAGRLLGVDVDFLRFHAGLPPTTHAVR